MHCGLCFFSVVLPVLPFTSWCPVFQLYTSTVWKVSFLTQLLYQGHPCCAKAHLPMCDLVDGALGDPVDGALLVFLSIMSASLCDDYIRSPRDHLESCIPLS